MHFLNIIIYCNCGSLQYNSGFSISDIADICNIFITFLTFALAYYVFVYQKAKDNKDILRAAELTKKTNKLQWFKELIIQPKINEVYIFYDQIRNLKNRINSNDLSDDQKIDLINFIKNEQSKLRKSFVDTLQLITPELFENISNNLDSLTDALTIAISNDELKLSNPKTYEKEIGSKIQYSYNKFFAIIFEYEG